MADMLHDRSLLAKTSVVEICDQHQGELKRAFSVCVSYSEANLFYIDENTQVTSRRKNFAVKTVANESKQKNIIVRMFRENFYEYVETLDIGNNVLANEIDKPMMSHSQVALAFDEHKGLIALAPDD